MEYQCEIIEHVSQPTLHVRTRAPASELPSVFAAAFQAIGEHLASIGEFPGGPPYGAYHNMDMADLDLEIGFPVQRELPGVGEIRAGLLPGGPVAACLHVGAYEGVEQAYAALSKFVAERNLAPTGVAYEFYLNDPATTDPDKLQTRITYPLKR